MNILHHRLLLLFSCITTVFASDNVISGSFSAEDELRKCNQASEQSINKCLQPILSYANSLQKKTDAAHFSPLQGGDIFRKLCHLYDEFKSCTKSLTCNSLSLKAVDASYGYMCGQGYSLFEEHAACFAEVENEPAYTACKHAASEAMDDALKFKQENVDLYFKKLCNVMDDYLSCCRPFVKHKCGSDAWQLVSQITLDSLGVTMPMCDIHHVLV
ncbi:chondroitin proteoglycan 4 domain-containing protein [Ditylenchus destructor]|nr:chondroitin proteoglycan 4 domain-containing protein [Ditylenchus destructor]